MLLVNAYSSRNDSLCAVCSTLPSLPATWKYSENILLFHSKSRTEKWKWLSVTWRRQTVSARAFYSVRFICASNRYLLYFFDNEYFRSYWRNKLKGFHSPRPADMTWSTTGLATIVITSSLCAWKITNSWNGISLCMNWIVELFAQHFEGKFAILSRKILSCLILQQETIGYISRIEKWVCRNRDAWRRTGIFHKQPHLNLKGHFSRRLLVLPVKHDNHAIYTAAEQKSSIISVYTLSLALKFFSSFLGFQVGDQISPWMAFKLVLPTDKKIFAFFKDILY